ncbi:MAG TPA: hypothetical protein VLG47_03475 [Candidatus Saccharimonadales bacterium]|nr:hypothetical protein [Candidatus Saccharimonadales bacterium]
MKSLSEASEALRYNPLDRIVDEERNAAVTLLTDFVLQTLNYDPRLTPPMPVKGTHDFIRSLHVVRKRALVTDFHAGSLSFELAASGEQCPDTQLVFRIDDEPEKARNYRANFGVYQRPGDGQRIVGQAFNRNGMPDIIGMDDLQVITMEIDELVAAARAGVNDLRIMSAAECLEFFEAEADL